MAYDIQKAMRIWAPEGEVRAVVQIIHGMAEYIGRYERAALEMNRHGIAVAGLDLRGHGEQAELKGYFADRDGWDHLVTDAHDLTLLLKKRFPGVPFVLMGHSMGSFVAREYAIRYNSEIDALVLSGTGHYPKGLCMAGRLLAALSPRRSPARLVDKIAFSGNNKPFEPGRTPFDWLSRDEKEVDKYIASDLCGFCFTGSAFHDFFGGLIGLTKTDRLASIRKDLPVLLISGDADPVGQMGAGVKQTAEEYKAAGLQDVTCKLYPDARHELLNETNRDEVTEYLIRQVLRMTGVEKA